jgi:hypothetical protein
MDSQVLMAYLNDLVGQPLAVVCARYCYRGILEEYDDECLILNSPHAVEVTGSATEAVPHTEDKLPGKICIKLAFIELIFEPTWCSHGVEK